MATVEADFLRDLNTFFQSVLNAQGYATKPGDDLATLFFNSAHRRVLPRSRQFFCSKELVCPSDLEVAFDALKAKVIGGADLNPHLSRKLIAQPDYNDGLLNDWGIQHFHLHTQRDSVGMIKGGPIVAYGVVTHAAVHFVQIGPHKADDFCDVELLEIVHTNWPELLEWCRWSSRPTGTATTSAQVSIARAQGMMVLVELGDGTIYRPVGFEGGGLSSIVRSNADYFLDFAQDLEAAYRREVDEIVLKNPGLPPDLKLRLSVDLTAWQAVVQEETSSTIFTPVALPNIRL